MNPSPGVCLQVRERVQWARELSASCREGSLEPGGQQGRTSPQSSRAEPLTINAKGDQCDMKEHFGVWSSAVSAVVWSLPQLYLGSGILYFSGSLDKCLGTPDGKRGLSPGTCLWVVPLCRHGCSDYVCRYLRCFSLPDVSRVT